MYKDYASKTRVMDYGQLLCIKDQDYSARLKVMHEENKLCIMEKKSCANDKGITILEYLHRNIHPVNNSVTRVTAF